MHIENLKRILRETEKINEYVKLASIIQRTPHTTNSALDLDEIIGMVQKRTDHLCRQLKKGIAIEEELLKIDELVKVLPGVEIFVFMNDLYQGIDHQKKPN